MAKTFSPALKIAGFTLLVLSLGSWLLLSEAGQQVRLTVAVAMTLAVLAAGCWLVLITRVLGKDGVQPALTLDVNERLLAASTIVSAILVVATPAERWLWMFFLFVFAGLGLLFALGNPLDPDGDDDRRFPPRLTALFVASGVLTGLVRTAGATGWF